MKRCSRLYVTRKVQIKTATSYHYMPIRRARINTDNTKCWWGCGATGMPTHCWCRCKTVLEVCTIWQFLRNLNIVLPYNGLIALLSIYSKELKIHVHTKTWHMDAYRSFTQNCQNLYATRTPFSRGMDTMVHKDNRILVSTKKKWNIKPWKDTEES